MTSWLLPSLPHLALSPLLSRSNPGGRPCNTDGGDWPRNEADYVFADIVTVGHAADVLALFPHLLNLTARFIAPESPHRQLITFVPSCEHREPGKYLVPEVVLLISAREHNITLEPQLAISAALLRGPVTGWCCMDSKYSTSIDPLPPERGIRPCTR